MFNFNKKPLAFERKETNYSAMIYFYYFRYYDLVFQGLKSRYPRVLLIDNEGVRL